MKSSISSINMVLVGLSLVLWFGFVLVGNHPVKMAKNSHFCTSSMPPCLSEGSFT